MKAVILAGGLGSRLKPFTEAIPKPLLPIGEKSILEIQIQHLAKYGFDEIYIATNYKADYIESFIGDGKRMGVKIIFSREEKPLGTCGPIYLLKDKLTEPFLLMNGDILSTIDFGKLFNFGCIKSDGDLIIDIEEKPDLVTEVLAGIYFMKPLIFDYMPENEYFGIDHLIKQMLSMSVPISKYLMSEYWLDIGRLDDFNDAQEAYEKHFK